MIWLLSVFWMAPSHLLLVLCFFTSSLCLGGKAKGTHHVMHLKVTVNVSAPVQLDKPMTVACIANMVIFRSKFLAPLGALIVSPFRDPSRPIQSTYRFDCSNLFNMALTDQTKMKINESGREWMKVNECG